MDSFPSFHYDWDTSSSSMNDPMVDSGKASDISVSSWPMEPIQWAPFPLLHQLSRQRPVSQGPGEGLEGPGRVCRGVQVPQTAPCPPHPGRVTPGKRWEHAWLRAAAPRAAQAQFTLCSTRPVGHSRSARGWSWAPWSGAGQPEATDNRQQQGSALKPTTFYFHVTSSVKEFHTLGRYNQRGCDVSDVSPSGAEARRAPAHGFLSGPRKLWLGLRTPEQAETERCQDTQCWHPPGHDLQGQSGQKAGGFRRAHHTMETQALPYGRHRTSSATLKGDTRKRCCVVHHDSCQ